MDSMLNVKRLTNIETQFHSSYDEAVQIVFAP